MRAATNDRMSLINLLSGVAHPTQAVADVLTIADQFAKGDVHVWRTRRGVRRRRDERDTLARGRVASTRVNVTIGAPPNYQLVAGGAEDPRPSRTGIAPSHRVAERSVKGADVIYTDAWVSMGMEPETDKRRRDLSAFRSKKTFSSSPSGAPC